MSKIEEALKKAKQSRGNASNSREIVNLSSADDRDVKNIVVMQNSKADVIAHKSSAKEIALMDNSFILDKNQLSELKIIFSDMSDNRIANIYRDLRTKLLQKSNGSNCTVMLASCVPGNESSYVSLNLATAFAFDESKTSLLIDCNLNNPQMDYILNMDSDLGLTDYLEREEVTVDSILHETGIKRLRMIPVGTSRETATEYFTSMRMRHLVSDLIKRYSDRFVFINSASILDSADSRILVDMCDYVILVVPYGRATKNKIKSAADAIGKEKLLGVVFNDIPKLPKVIVPGNRKKRK